MNSSSRQRRLVAQLARLGPVPIRWCIVEERVRFGSNQLRSLSSHSDNIENSLRSFLAIPLSEFVREEMRSVVNRLRAEHPSVAAHVKWVDPAVMHVTLKFLGEVNQSTLRRIQHSIPSVLASHSSGPFNIELSSGGVFWKRPPFRTNTHLWPGVFVILVDSGRDELEALARSVDITCGALDPNSFASETRPLLPHVTVARAPRLDSHWTNQKHISTAPCIDMLSMHKLGMALQTLKLHNVLRQRVEEVCLFRSDLRKGGPIYTVLESWSIKPRP